MLGRKNYTRAELDHARSAVDQQLASFRQLVEAAENTPSGAHVPAAVEALEPVLFNNLLLALDRQFVHRLRVVTGKDGNALNEVELIADSLLNNDGVLRGNSVIKYLPEQSVVGLNLGDRISLSAEQFERLAKSFLAEIESKFLGAET